jgi:hypothetical protein
MQLISVLVSMEDRVKLVEWTKRKKETEEDGDKSRKIKRRETNCYNCL